MVQCCVPYCLSKSGDIVSFHQFPADPELSKQWLTVISRKNFVVNDRSGSSVVCSMHFRQEDYVSGLKLKKLKKGSVPSIFPGYPSYKVPKQSQSRSERRAKRKCESGASSSAAKRLHSHSPNEKQVSNLTESDNSEVEREDVGNARQNSEKFQTSVDEAELLLHFASTAETEATSEMNNRLYKVPVTKKVRQLQSLLWKKNKKICKQQQEIKQMKEKLKYYEENEYYKTLEKLICLEECDHKMASFILQQIKNFGKKKPTWTEDVVRECVVWNATSPKGYSYARDQKLLSLPSRMTLSRYIGPVCGEFGITSLAQQRLQEEANKMNGYEKFCSLIIDEMAIKQQQTYDNKLDAFFGQKTSLENCDNKPKSLANRLLCFLLSGLSTTYSIPCAYFFTRQLSGEELHQLTRKVLEVVERCGFVVIRIVTDNHKTNVAMFRSLSGKKLTHKLPHPLDSSRPLFLSFDPNHIIKNIRSLFLENDMSDGKEIITGKYIKQLYKLQQNENIKAVRNLTHKHVNPSNFDKMNVGRAVLIFSPPVTAALEFLMSQSSFHPKADYFKDAGATVNFLKNIYKWFSVHDISSRQHHIVSNNQNRMHFFSCDDERLQWLQSDFLEYLHNIKEACDGNQPQLKFLSKETYEAIILTSKSSAECISYLLDSGYHYVLTRGFNSDPVESLFSALRQMNGGNDAMDVRATLFSMEKILKTGIIVTSRYSNVGKKGRHVSRMPSVLRYKCKKDTDDEDSLPELPYNILGILNALEAPQGNAPANLESASLAFVAGYLVRCVEENHDCLECLDNISSVSCSSPIFRLISLQDHGNLRYPSPPFVMLLSHIKTFAEKAIHLLPPQAIAQHLTKYIHPKLQQCPLLQCESHGHNSLLSRMICTKFIPVFLKNFAKTTTDQVKNKFFFNKPISRKALKLS